MKRHWDAVVAGFGLMLGVVAMAGTILTGEYAHAAGAEARGVEALFHVVADAHCEAANQQSTAQHTVLAMNEVAQ